MLGLYTFITRLSAPLLSLILKLRLSKGKEDRARIGERKGIASLPRPAGSLFWLHAASVGEAQSALILVDKLLEQNKTASVLVTSGTVTSANLMAKRLPSRAFHQFLPLDHPTWIGRFLDHWKPDFVCWMESELWPNTLKAVKNRNIPAYLLNARLSARSYKRWKSFPKAIQTLLSSFSAILTQTEEGRARFEDLGAQNVRFTDNIKHSAASLPVPKTELSELLMSTDRRKIWVYASTHAGEEELAAQTHLTLKKDIPELLTIIVPRHPERREDIKETLATFDLQSHFRSEQDTPNAKTDIYVADTLGELGLFYQLSDIAMIGRSFSADGGGGHNPIEAAQLGCAVLTGPNIQFQRDLFDEMFAAGAAKQVQTPEELCQTLIGLFNNEVALNAMIKASEDFANSKNHIIDDVMTIIRPSIPPSTSLTPPA